VAAAAMVAAMVAVVEVTHTLHARCCTI
jgi:hypothetical protein